MALPAFPQVQADVTALEAHSSLAVWRQAHPGERFERAHYETAADGYEVDYARRNRWCAASIGRTPEGIARAALFYVPDPLRPALPARTENCELDAVWYRTPAADARDNLVRELSSAWGLPNGASAEPDIRGWANWKAVAAWHRGGIDVWVARDGAGSIVYARRTTPRDPGSDPWFGSVLESQAQVADAVARIAALGGELTAPVLSKSRCAAGPEERVGEQVEPLARWLGAAQALPPPRRAAALLLADFYIACIGAAPDPDRLQKRLTGLGANYATDYTHNLREQAERLDPRGPAGELAGLIGLTEPCFLKGNKPWPDLVAEKGARMLNVFPATAWTPYIHYVLARAHAMKLSRTAAISEFRYFIKQKPDAPESVFARQEAWRLLAGLPPSQIHFGCSGE